jgi:Raf kinase inhibitor-like YbhB/YbcL family protein
MRVSVGEDWKRIGVEMRRAMLGAAAGLLFAVTAVNCRGAKLELKSSSFQNGSSIPVQFTCDGADVSPRLNWNAPPAGTKALVLIVLDPDAPGGSYTHWLLYDLPARTRSLAAALPLQDQLGDGARQGRNDLGKTGYGGPCPPGHQQHHYLFTLFALDRRLNLAAGATRSQVEAAMRGHVLALSELTGVYRR